LENDSHARSLKTPRREDLKTRKKSLCSASPLCILASLRESIFINCTATCLSSIDALITPETQQYEAIKTHKKFLVQQLFPSPVEVGK